MRRWKEFLALVVGVGVGFVGASSATPVPEADVSSVQRPPVESARWERPPATSHATTTTTDANMPTTYLVWISGGLPPEFGSALQAGFGSVSIVRGDTVLLPSDGAFIPLDALAIDARAHAPFDPEHRLGALIPGSVVLGETSAEIRGLTPGDVLSIGESSFTVADVVPDALVAGAEVVFSVGDTAAPVSSPRYALISTRADRAQVEQIVRSSAPDGIAVRIRTAAETPWLRHGDAVLPQVFIKDALGEFRLSPGDDGAFSEDTGFTESRIVTADIPILGAVTCHEVVVELLAGAMKQIDGEGLAHLIDPTQSGGCWNPRFIGGVKGGSSSVSRHAWGAAIDLNVAANPQGSIGAQDPRVVDIMSSWGFAWGGEWLVPDPMHFEYAVDPTD